MEIIKLGGGAMSINVLSLISPSFARPPGGVPHSEIVKYLKNSFAIIYFAYYHIKKHTVVDKLGNVIS